ncbi:hypothetical protein PTSG_09904 [Salpingoeca rosetta]|uniref:Uncharacterized protein n=1 Tax=Salpingoeca rosetta (strain ATCC 50818 / BSB-021) TaxID=946362 RepID=F2UNG7_SALR5|nr:uncharacterized protein PTSG_09904 [Salpingoeca rosetta]EGD79172.1 hypothetical protein PTSG_09904 [Salpingoeca rosetta]|eukprot:XP_004989257.1 hypothetical protein PTSG_09904 [Salpingoeca rosetta]
MEKELSVCLDAPADGVKLDTVSVSGCIRLVVKRGDQDGKLQPGDELLTINEAPAPNILLANRALKTKGTSLVIKRNPMAVVGKPATLTTVVKQQAKGRTNSAGAAHHGTAAASRPPAHHGAETTAAPPLSPSRLSPMARKTADLISKAKKELASNKLVRRRRSSFSTREKHMRLFISSSFVDMHLERDLLMKHVFPKVRNACLQMGAQFTEIDLRWGIDEQSQMPQVIATCLTEVTRCRPFILCILGHRYGWQPPMEALQEACGLAPDLQWTLDAHGCSITHMEAMAGILRLPESERRGLVYLRSEEYLKTLEKPLQQEYSTTDADARSKMAELRQTLLNTRGITVRTYNRPDDLPQMVMEDLLARCQGAFAHEALTDPYQQDNFSHNAFGASRAATYIPFPHLQELIGDIQQRSSNTPVHVLGESGTGKSSIMAAFLDQVLEQPNALTFFHFIGHSSHSAHHVNLLKRLLHQLKQWAPDTITEPVPSTAAQLAAALPSWLSTASTARNDKTIFICLDALNQLQNIDNAHELAWLPKVFPANVRVVLSSTPCRSADVVSKRGWDVKHMPHIGKYERITYALLFLNKRGKELSFDRLHQIVSAEHVTSLLHLRLILEELQVSASFDTLDTFIPRMLAPPTLPAFFGLVLQRLEDTYNDALKSTVAPAVARRGIVGSIMCYVACAQHGITETELMAVLGVARSQISTLMFAVEEFMQINTGYVLFAHEAFLKAVEGKYLSTDAHRTAVHAELAAFFAGTIGDNGCGDALPTDEESSVARVCAELPWHLLLSKQTAALCAFLTRIPIYRRMRASEFLKLELASFWREVGLDEASARYPAALAAYLRKTNLGAVEAADVTLALATGLHEWGEYGAAEQLYQSALDTITDGRTTPLLAGHNDNNTNTSSHHHHHHHDDDDDDEHSNDADVDRGLSQAQSHVLAEVLVGFARLRTHQSRGREAQALLRRAHPMFVRMFGADSREATQVLDDLAWNQIMAKQLRGERGAVSLLKQSLLAKLRAMPSTIAATMHLDTLDGGADLDDDAWTHVIDTLAANPKQTPRTVPPALNRLALAYSNLGHMRIAEQLFSCSLLLHRSLWGDQHPNVALVLGDLGSLYARQIPPEKLSLAAQGEVYLYDAADPERSDAQPLRMDVDTLFSKAKQCYEEAIAIRTQTLGREHPFTATSLKGLGDLLCRRARVQDALVLYRQCHEIRLDALGKDNKQTQLVAARLRELGEAV